MTSESRWTLDRATDLTDKTIIVTGANSGLGYETSRGLANRGAQVVLACRSLDKAETAIAAIKREIPGASLEAMSLDLADLTSVREFAKQILDRYESLDVLCNNAGVMALPYGKTADGFEMQIGTNHLGHFALTGLLLERLLAGSGGRVVNVSSNAHRLGRMNFDDLQSERRYGKWVAYAQSKLANLLFTYEFERRCKAAGASLVVVACHPGYAATNLQVAGPRLAKSRWLEGISRLGNLLVAQSAAMGALPTLHAVTAGDLRGGEYVGPRIAATWGQPTLERPSARASHAEDALRLWRMSEDLTGVRYGVIED